MHLSKNDGYIRAKTRNMCEDYCEKIGVNGPLQIPYTIFTCAEANEFKNLLALSTRAILHCSKSAMSCLYEVSPNLFNTAELTITVNFCNTRYLDASPIASSLSNSLQSVKYLCLLYKHHAGTSRCVRACEIIQIPCACCSELPVL